MYMSIRPVDFQIMLPKTAEVSKINSDEQQRSQIMQQQQNANLQHKVDNSIKQVHSQDNVQEAMIREKRERERDNQKKQDKRKKGNYNNKKETDDGIQTSTIDIRL